MAIAIWSSSARCSPGDPGGPLRFSLVSPSELLALAEAAGLRLLSLGGDYDGSGYDEATSPTVIATLERTV